MRDVNTAYGFNPNMFLNNVEKSLIRAESVY